MRPFQTSNFDRRLPIHVGVSMSRTARRVASRVPLAIAALWLISGWETRAQEKRPADPTEGVYRAEKLGVEYQFVSYRGHLAAKILRILSPTAPVLRIRTDSGDQQLEPGDLIVSLDDQVFDSPRDVDNHVDVTTIDVIDVRTNRPVRGVMRLPSAVAQGPAGESRMVRALLVIDMESGLAGLDEDREHIVSMLHELQTQGRAQVTVLQRRGEATAQAVQNFFRAQPDASADTILFYYSGHGATDPRRGHYMAPTLGPALLRSSVRQEIARIQPRMTILLTDCCSNVSPLAPAPGAPSPDMETVRDLFLRASGIVDITAATYDARSGTEESAWCDASGGFFTSALNMRILFSPRQDLDRDRNGRVTWAELAPALISSTNRRYKDFRNGILSGNGINPTTGQPYSRKLLDSLRKQPQQRPQVFALDTR